MVCVLTHPLYIRVVLSTPESHSRNSLAIPEVSQSRKVDQTLRTGTDGHNLKEDQIGRLHMVNFSLFCRFMIQVDT